MFLYPSSQFSIIERRYLFAIISKFDKFPEVKDPHGWAHLGILISVLVLKEGA